jgi:ribosome-associated toxin RatA of RatAB toxin-antitoxin module
MRSTIGIDVAASPETVFRLARDVERWPRLLPHYVAATRLGPPDRDGRLLVRFVAIRPVVRVLGLGIPVAWRSVTWSEPETCRLRFRHRGGATNGMDVTWRIEPRAGGGSRVEIDHDFRPRVPGWARLVDHFFTHPVAGRTLGTFRDLAEALAADDDQSAAAISTKTPA